jgi:hypothetical protein
MYPLKWESYNQWKKLQKISIVGPQNKELGVEKIDRDWKKESGLKNWWVNGAHFVNGCKG